MNAPLPSKQRDYAGRLRGWLGHPACPAQSVQDDLRAGADEIDRLRAELAEVRAVALEALKRPPAETSELERLRKVVAHFATECPWHEWAEKARKALRAPEDTTARRLELPVFPATHCLSCEPGKPCRLHSSSEKASVRTLTADSICCCGKRMGEHPALPPWWPCMLNAQNGKSAHLTTGE
jgi:hypothetical protein